MSPQSWSRRAVLASIVLLGSAKGHVAAQDRDAGLAALSFRGIAVDASKVAATGAAALAAHIERQLGRDARDVFADRIRPADPSASQLVLRITSVQLAAYAGNEGTSVFGNGANTDYLEGAGLVTSGGRVLSTTPILATLDASYSGAWYLPDIDERRVASITHQFAYWLRREMGI